MPRLNKQGIVTGLIVSASHVFDIIDALTFSSSIDILVSGAFCVGTSVSGSDKVKVLGNVNVLGPITASNLYVNGGPITGSSIFLSGPITASNISSSQWSTAYNWSLQSWVSSSETSSWNTAYNKTIVSASFSGSANKTLYLGYRDGSAISASFINTGSGTVSGSNRYIAMFSSGSRNLVESLLLSTEDNRLGNTYVSNTFAGDINANGASQFNGPAIFISSSTFQGKIEKNLTRVTSDANYTILNNSDYFIVLDVQITSNRSLAFLGAAGAVPPQELTFINMNTTPNTWSFSNDGASAISVSVVNFDGSAVTRVPAMASVTIVRYINAPPNFTYVLRNYNFITPTLLS